MPAPCLGPLLACAAALQAAPVQAAPVQAAPVPSPADAAKAAFGRLGALAGDWEAKTAKGTPVRIGFRLAAAGSVLVLSYGSPGPRQTLTLFHLDGDRLLATHYCAQGNQPRLRLEADRDGQFTFTFLDASNLPDPRASHLRRLQLEPLGPDRLRHRETYAADGREDTQELGFLRVP